MIDTVLKKMSGDILEWNGHYCNGNFWHKELWFISAYDRIKEILKRVLQNLNIQELEYISSAVDSDVKFDPPIDLGFVAGEYVCPFCDRSLHLGFNGRGLICMGDPCKFPEGIVTEWELNVPSGKIVVDDDLRNWFPIDRDWSINTVIGKHLTTLAYAKVGMAHGYVGNSCPQIYKNEDSFSIISRSDDADSDRSIAHICTDLWWFSIADYDELKRRAKYYTPKLDFKKIISDDAVSVVDVKPGVYQFRQDHNIEFDSEIIEFATFVWIRDPDPVQDFIKIETEKYVSAIEALVQQCLSWPTLYMGMSGMSRDITLGQSMARWNDATDEDRCRWLALSADHFMCVIGGGVEWHENGFPRIEISNEAKILAAKMGHVPKFNCKTRWYPVSKEYSALCLGSKTSGKSINFSDEFVELSQNICQNAIRFGGGIQPSRNQMELFINTYRKLRKRYPKIVFDKDFDDWFHKEDFHHYLDNFFAEGNGDD